MELNRLMLNPTVLYLQLNLPQIILNLTVKSGNVYENITEFTVKVPNEIWFVYLTVDGNTYFMSHIDPVDDKFNLATLQLDNISAGTHEVVASFDGNGYYTGSSNSTNITIAKANPNIDIIINPGQTYTDGINLEPGKDINISAFIGKYATGTAVIYINGTFKAVKVINGYANATFSGVYAQPGINYNVTVEYWGDDNYNETNKSSKFNVTKYPISISDVTQEVLANNTVVFTITLNETDADGTVSLNISGYNLYNTYAEAIVENGVATAYIHGVPVGFTAEVNVTYLGNDRYFNATKMVSLTSIPQLRNFTIDVEVIEGSYRENTTIIITVPAGTEFDNLRDNLKVKIQNYDKNINEYDNNEWLNLNYTYDKETGVLKINVSDLTVGKHNVNASFENNTYSLAWNDTNFTVGATENYTFNLTVEPAECFGNETVINITVPYEFTSFNLTIDDVTYLCTVDRVSSRYCVYDEGGNLVMETPINYVDTSFISGSFKTANLTAGDHVVTISYAGDENYTAMSNSTSFSIAKANANMTGYVIANVSGKEYPQNITGQDIGYVAAVPGSAVNVTVFVGKNATGKVVISVDGVDHIVDVVNGTAVYVYENAVSGTHNVTFEYLGDDNYNASGVSEVLQFNVTTFEVDVIPGNHNEATFFNVTVSKDITEYEYGNICVEIFDEDGHPVTEIGYYSSDEYDNFNIVTFKGSLPSGNYTVNVTYNKGSYNPINVTADFTVGACDNYTFNLTVVPAECFGNETVINITVLPDQIAKFNLTIDDVTYLFEMDSSERYNVYDENGEQLAPISGTPVDGAYVFSFVTNNLTAGNHIATISFAGNESYVAKSNSTSFSIAKANANMTGYVIANVTGQYEPQNITSPDNSYAALPGSAVNVTVFVGKNATGKVVISVDGVPHIVDVVNGTGVYVYENAVSGTHNVTFEYLGDNNYLNGTNDTVKFNVTTFDLDVYPGTCNNDTVFNVTVSSDIDPYSIGVGVYYLDEEGNFIFDEYGNPKYEYMNEYMIDSREVYPPLDGMSVVKIKMKLAGGNYFVNVTNGVGDNPLIANATFTVDAVNDYVLNITVVPAECFGNDTLINITVPSDLGSFNVTVGDKTYMFNYTDGKYEYDDSFIGMIEENGVVNFTIKVNDLPAGVNTAVVKFDGNENYTAMSNSTSFSIAKANATMNVTVNDEEVYDSYVANSTLNITIGVGNNATGYVTVKINDYFDIYEVIDGKVNITLENIQPGEYNVTAKYLGDNNYNASEELKFNFTIKKYDIQVKDINYTVLEDNTVLVNVTFNETDATGNVTINVDGKEYNATVIDGKAIIYVNESLTVNYDNNIDVIYSGDDRYNGVSDSFGLKVGRLNNLTIDVSVVPGEFGKNTTVVVSMPVKLDENDVKNNLIVEISNGTDVVYVDSSLFAVEYDYDNNVTVVSMNVSGLAVGVHEVNVTYGDASYNDTYNNGTLFEIAKGSDYVFDITVDAAVCFGNDTLINITVPSDLGSFNVTVGDKTYMFNYTDGKYEYDDSFIGMIEENGVVNFTIKVNDLPAGVNTAVVKFDGNENYTAKVNSTTFEIPKATPVMEVSINGSDAQESYEANTTLNITVYVGENATGFMKINIGDATEIVEVINGTATLIVENIQPGAYNINATYLGDSNYVGAGNDSVEFNISTYKISVDNVAYDVLDNNSVIFTVTLNETDATGNLTIVINGVEYNATVENGKATVYVNDSLAQGDNIEYEVIYSGDDRYSGLDEYYNNLTVPKLNNLTIDVSVVPAEHGENTTITVTVPEDVDKEKITVYVDDKAYNYNDFTEITEDGVTKLVLNVTPSVDAHEVNVTLTGDERYNDTYNNGTKFNITQKDNYEFGVEVIPAPFGENTTIVVTAPKDAEGVNVTVDDVVYPAVFNETSGKYELVLNNLTAGKHNVVASVEGLENYTNKSDSKQFTIPKAATEVNVTVNGTTAGEDVTITVSVGENATGNVIVTVDGVEHIVKVDENGNATYVIHNAQPGKHNVTAQYLGDDNNNASEVSEVKKFAVDLFNITIKEINVTLNDDNSASVKVVMNETANGNVTIATDNGQFVTVPVVNGVTVANLTSLGNPGSAEITVTYLADDKFNTTTNVTTVDLPKMTNATVSVEVVPAEHGENTTITVTVPDFEGNVTVIIDGVEYPVEIDENGVGVLNVTPTVGNHTLKVKLNNSDKYNDTVFDQDNFTVVANSNFTADLEVVPAAYGENTTITVKVPVELKDDVTLTIDGKEYEIEINDEGIGVLNVTGIPAGDHEVVVSTGNENYTAKTNSTVFNIPKVDANMTIETAGSTAGENVTVTVYVGVNATGNVALTIDGTTVIVPVDEDGYAIYNITNAQPGKHNVTAKYFGDGNYSESDISDVTEFNVDLFNVTIEDISVELNPDNSAKVTVTFNESDVGGTVTVTDGTQEVTVPVVDGVAVADLESLGFNKTATITATYNGDDARYNKTEKSTDVDLPLLTNGTVEIGVVPGQHGDNTTITITVPEDFDGNVTVLVNGTPVDPEDIIKVAPGVYVVNVTPDVGPNEIEVKLTNSSKYDDMENSTKVVIESQDEYEFEVEVIPAEYGENSTVIVTVPDELLNNDDVVITVDGKKVNATVVDGKLVANISGIGAGDHEIVVTAGNENYTTKENRTTLTVPKAVVEDVVVDVNGSTAGEDVVITVPVGPNATGSVVVTVDGVEHVVPVDENGNATYVIHNAQPGAHNVTAEYLGDNNYTKFGPTDLEEFEVGLFNVTIEDISVELNPDNSAKVTIKFNESDVGGTVTVSDGTQEVIVPVVDGVAVADLESLGFNKTATITATYNGDDARYNKTEKSTDVDLPLLTNGTVEIGVVPGQHGDNTTITITVPEDFDGNVTVLVNGTPVDPEDIIEVAPGVYVVNVTPDVGPNEIEVKLTNSSKYDDMENSTTVTIESNDNYTVDIEVIPGNYGENTTITVKVPKELKDNVTVTIDGKEVTIPIDENGEGILNISTLSAGPHEIVVSTGDENYTAKENKTTFTVPQTEIEPIIEIEPIVGETATVKVTLPEDATGTVYVEVNGTKYFADVESGSAIIEIPKLGNGTHDVKVTYSGDENYTAFNETKQLTVSKVEENITAETAPITLGENAVINVTVPEDATGTVTVQIGDIVKTVAVAGGVNEIIVPGVPVGDHEVIITYNGDDKYAAVNTTTALNVAPVDTKSDDIKVEDTGNGTIKVTVPENATGNVTVVVDGKEYTVPVDENGTAVFNLTNLTDLNPGVHNVTIKYSGDENNTAVEFNTTVTIPKLSSEVSATAPTIREGDDAVISIEVDKEDAKGMVLVDIDGIGYYAEVVDGKATVTVPGLKE